MSHDMKCHIMTNEAYDRDIMVSKRTSVPDMQKVEILPPADFRVKISAKVQNRLPLLGFIHFCQFSEIFR